jgi:CRP-like cAMP-binding protein/thioredoxin reductase/ferredoxin-like protein FixX
MAERFKIAIIGSGPAGLSAACRAAKNNISHVLLERANHVCDTIFKYQKRKHVMATPDFLPLRSDSEFVAGQREDVLSAYDKGLAESGANIRLSAEVTGISGGQGNFAIKLADGSTVAAEFVVLAIGLQGNLRKLTVPGAEQPWVQYQLDDPDAYQNENIVVIGGGDAGIENALGLANNNNVSIVNNQAEFAHAKPANVALVQAAVKDGRLTTYMSATTSRIEPGRIILTTPSGEAAVKVDRVIARIGALPPRKFVESCGIKFPSDAPTAVPRVSETYESNVPGLYIIGALAGYPLIKHCMNQGYEVVEFILGNRIAPADEPLIQSKLDRVGIQGKVADLIEAIRTGVPLFRTITPLQIREILLASEVHNLDPGQIVFERHDYTNSVFVIVRGEVAIEVDASRPEAAVKLDEGAFFGEMGLISGRRRTATVRASQPSLLVEIPRNAMIRLVRSVPDVKRQMDEVATIRQFQTYIAPGISADELAAVIKHSQIVAFKPGEALVRESEVDDTVFLIRTGSVTVSRSIGGREVVISYVPAGHHVGEVAMLTRSPRSATVKAAVATEAIRIDAEPLRALLERFPKIKSEFAQRMSVRGMEAARLESRADRLAPIGELLGQGLGEATDVLLIDESLCVQCNNCERACAETHNGISRLDRQAGPTFATIHVPTSCRHCEHPHCMKDCPPDALSRTKDGEVFIDQQKCIGCGNCERNCPYGVIHMSYQAPKKPGLLSWLLFGLGHGPGEDHEAVHAAHQGAKKAVKCDLCKDIDGGPSCVRACPTGAAIRAHPQQLFNLIKQSP